MDPHRWQRIEKLFARAAELEAEERQAFLDRACGDDNEVRREVASLLAAHSQAEDDFLRSPGDDTVAGLVDEVDPAPERIGPWRVLGEIGRGGMGVVYDARRDDGQFEQRAAVKLIKRGMASDQLLKRFLRERQILARMEHPGIARLLDGGVTDEERPWFALERIDGVPLTEYCDTQQLALSERLRLFAEVCSAVEYAHRNLVIHRDLKPSNVFVDASGHVKLLDFGIAKLLQDSEESLSTLSMAGGRLMTPAYGAPELLVGGPINTATDVYSLGVMLYELLTGQLPYDHRCEKPEAGPPKLSTLAASNGRRLDEDLDTIAAKAVQIEPEQRYASVEALREDIERYLRSEPVRASASSTLYRARKFLQRHRTSVLAAMLVIASMMAGLSTALWQARVAARERDAARDETAQNEQVKNFIIDLFRASDPRDPRGTDLTARELLDRGLERVRDGLEDRPDLRIEMMAAISEVSLSLGDYEGARELLDEALDIELGDGRLDQLRVAKVLNGLGQALAYQGKLEEAEHHYRRALAIRIELGDLDSFETGNTYNNLGVALASQRKLPEAIAAYESSLKIQEVVNIDELELLRTRGNLANAYRLQGDFPKAGSLLRQVISETSRLKGDNHPDLIAYLDNLGSVEKSLGHYREAESLLRRSLDLSREAWGESHPETRIGMNNYALLAHHIGKDSEAEPLLRTVLKHDLEQFGSEHRYVALGRDNLGSVLLELGRVDEALAEHELASTIHTASSPARYLAINKVRHAWALFATGQHERARERIEVAVTTYREDPSGSSVRLAGALTTSGIIHHALGHEAASEALFGEALELYESLMEGEFPKSDHPNSGLTWLGLGELRLSQGRLDDAHSHLTRASTVWSERLPADHWRHAEVRVALGECLLRQGKAEAGRQMMVQAIEALRKSRGEDHWRIKAAIARLEAHS